MSINATDLQTRVHGLEVHVEELTKDFTALQKKYESIVQKNIKAPGDHLYYCMRCQDFKNIFFKNQISIDDYQDTNLAYRITCPTCREKSSPWVEGPLGDMSDEIKNLLKTELIGKGILVVKEESKANQ